MIVLNSHYSLNPNLKKDMAELKKARPYCKSYAHYSSL